VQAKENHMIKPATKTYDTACLELAEHFMQDEPCRNDPVLYKSMCHQLAIWIQESVEDWFVTPEQT